MKNYLLDCLICNDYRTSNLVRLQEHAMQAHDITREQLRVVRRTFHARGVITWRLAGGKPLMRAEHIESTA